MPTKSRVASKPKRSKQARRAKKRMPQKPIALKGKALRAAMIETAESGDFVIAFADGFDAALLGFARRFNDLPVACYDLERCISILMQDGMSHEEAVEYFDFNVIGAWIGETTPVFVEQPLG